jgi:disulfide bond formation protein DsbB
LSFERREILLIAGILFFLIGLIGVGLQPIYAIIISITIYIGIKVIVGRKKKMIFKSVGEGICIKCGEKVTNKKCPNCDSKPTKN